ncbi:MAG: nucleoside-triphosphatase [Bacillota bacterium]
MVKIVTGKINSYKTTKLENIYRKIKNGDGFIAKKTMKNDLVYGYTLVRLSNGDKTPFIIRDIYYDNNKDIIYKLGPYLFYKDAFNYINETVNEWIKKDINPIFIDEISILELQEKGYYKILMKLLSLNKDLYLVVRSDLIEKVIKKFRIKEFQIIRG